MEAGNTKHEKLPGFFHPCSTGERMRQLGPDLQDLLWIRPEKETEQLPWRRLPAEEAELAATTVIFGIPNVLPGGVDVSRVGNNE